jgi:hypothetical protein
VTESGDARRNAARVLRPVAFAILGLVAAALLTLTAGTAGGVSCSLCHAELAYDSSTAHASLDCAQCHRDEGVAGVMTWRLQVVEMALSPVTRSSGTSMRVKNGRCLSCHQDAVDATLVARGIRMSHKEPLRAGADCSDCHARGLHAPISIGASGIDMGQCLRCHVVSPLSADCATCHLEQVTRERRLVSGAFAKTHGPSWSSLHGMGDLNTCSACHSVARCDSCHGTALPHTEQWLNRHGGESEAESARCEQCHSTQFCDDCHGMSIPHPRDFRATHGDQAKTLDAPACVLCHDLSSCETCHLRHIHPGLKPDQVKALRQRAGLDD